MRIACAEIQTLIPFDAANGVFDMSNLRFLEGIGQSESLAESYNNHYRMKHPLVLKAGGKHLDNELRSASNRIDWRDFEDEFAVDFMVFNGMCKSLRHGSPGHQIGLTIHRSRLSPDFSDSEIDTLGLINQHLNNLFACFRKKEDSSAPDLAPEVLAEKFPCLSRREAEVCFLIARRFNTVEISTCLFISGRTVEKHLESIFDKLNVQSREQLRLRLGVTPATGNLALQSIDL